MRNYPSVPNVFRVASSHSVNNEASYAPGGGSKNIAAGNRNATTAAYDANTIFATLTMQQHHQQQQQQQQQQVQQQQQQQLKRPQQSFANVSKMIASTTTTTTSTTITTTSTITIATSTPIFTVTSAPTGGNGGGASTFGSNFENEQFKQKQYHHLQQQQQQQMQQQRFQLHGGGGSVNSNGNTITAIVSGTSNNCNGNDVVINKLTTTASIEGHNYYDREDRHQHQQQQHHLQQKQQKQLQLPQQQQQLHTPYASLPRSISGLGNGDLHRNAVNRNGNTLVTGASASSGAADVINTISGSIPATGIFGNAGRFIGSDLNLNSMLNNSCADLGRRRLSADGSAAERLKRSEDYHFTRCNQTDLGDGLDYSMKKPPRTPYPCNRFQRYGNANGNGYLWILTPVAASISVAIVIAALAGPQWLFTEEKLPNSLYNGTANFNALDDGAYITKYTKSSLWILCTTLQGIQKYNCVKIEHFSHDGYSPDPHDSTSAIPYTVTKSCPFFMASGIALLISFIVYLIPTCSHQNSLYYFSAGIMFIVSGLLMLVGLIAYISILKSEIGSKLRSRSSLQPPLFKVNYGQSFFLFVFGFVATEFVGLLNIFLYISLQEVSYYSKLPCFTLSNIREKIREGKNPRSRTYKSYKNTIPNDERAKATAQRMRPTNSSSSSNHRQVHNVRRARPQQLGGDIEPKKSSLKASCRRHPTASNSSNMDRRYYFDNSLSMNCDVHSRSLARSLNELYTESMPPPPPVALNLKARVAQTLPRQQQQSSNGVSLFADLPQEFPLTRSISTTTDIFQSDNSIYNHHQTSVDIHASGQTPTHLERRTRRNMATNTTRPTDTELLSMDYEDMRQQLAARRRQNRNELSNNNNSSNNSNDQPNGNRDDGNDVNGDGDGDDDDGDVDVDDDDDDNVTVIDAKNEKKCNSNRNANRLYADDSTNHNADDIDDDDDGDGDGEEEPQRLCGLKRSIRKTKDELFQEFCKRAGMRPKPKNIYYIANEEEMLRRKRQFGDLSGIKSSGLKTVPDEVEFDDADDDEAIKQLRESRNRRIYSIEDSNAHESLSSFQMRNARRASMFAEPAQLRKLNSNLSLHTFYPPDNHTTAYQKGFYDAAAAHGNNDIWPTYPQPLRTAFGGSQSRLDSTINLQNLQQNRSTLPRSFLKNYTESQDSIASASIQELNNAYSASQTPPRLSTPLMLQQQNLQKQQHQQQHQPHLLSLPHYNSNSSYLHKSYDDLNASNYTLSDPAASKRPLARLPEISDKLQQPVIQWPAAIPSSPSNYSANYHLYGHSTLAAHPLVARSFSGTGGDCGAVGVGVGQPNGQAKFQRAFAFDEHRRPSIADPFDMDEGRRSQASLFNGNVLVGGGQSFPANTNADHYDMFNGTAV